MGRRVKAGGLPFQDIIALIKQGHIRSDFLTSDRLRDEHVQSSSLNVLLSDGDVHEMNSSSPPLHNKDVLSSIKDQSHRTSYLGTDFAMVPPTENGNGVYVMRLALHLDLPSDIGGYASGRSSGARKFNRARLLLDGVHAYDKIPLGYKGQAWLELTTTVFPEIISRELAFSQLYFHRGKLEDCRLSDEQIRQRHTEEPLLYENDGKTPVDMTPDILNDGIHGFADLRNDFAYVGRKDAPYLDCRENAPKHDPRKFYERARESVVLHHRTPAVVRTMHKFCLPADISGKIVEIDTEKGDMFTNFSTHANAGYLTPTPFVGELLPVLGSKTVRHGDSFTRYHLFGLIGKSDKVYRSTMTDLLPKEFDMSVYKKTS